MGEGGLLPSVKLFGVHLQSSTSSLLGDCNSSSNDIHCNGLPGMRKCVSMGNLGNFSHSTLVANISSSEEHTWKPNCLSPSPPFTNTSIVDRNANSHGYLSDGLVHSSLNGRLRERKKGVPWTEDEHRLFLMGLQKLGKGDWRGISKSFVMSRTPTQVASHAQKYFLRRSNLNKRKRRSSLFDIMSDHLPHAMTVSSSCSLDHLSQKPLASIMDLNVFESSRPMAMPQTNNVTALADHGLRFEHRLLETSIASKPLDHSYIPEFTHNIKTLTSTPMLHTSPRSLTTPSCASSSTLYRIDETKEISGLGLSIGLPTSMDHQNSFLTMEQPRSFSTPPLMHSSSSTTAMPSSNNNTSLANAMISVV